MTYEEAIQILLRGGKVKRDGKTLVLRQGVWDVTDPEKPERVHMNDAQKLDWSGAEEVQP